ncbi:Thiamine-monophosphate kinase [Botrimarina mediterranea]|uniref:Thiamine-monophosphate kinase n=2 Tax=Botrimarina mediterranea TaxID=2528022 RepID=A0A518K591_9BACT|nr:Thiamine-monophosphate kinase [Botrimarina mediterranea]
MSPLCGPHSGPYDWGMELEFVRWLHERLPALSEGQIGVGDDAAVVALGGSQLVATADLLIDGVHFDTSQHAIERIGRKSLGVNLSDLAAMAARPVGCLVSLALPRGGVGGVTTQQLAMRLVEGMAPLAKEFGCPIIGGDTNVHSGPLVINVTAFGEPTERGVVRRDGARPGDVLLVTGDLGGSLSAKQFDFTPRVHEALTLHAAAPLRALMDLSDGLSLDLTRLCEASGVAALVDADAIPISNAAKMTGEAALDHALSDGEDFELLIAAAPDDAKRLLAEMPVACGLTRIGETMAGSGVSLRYADGTATPLDAKGYQHQ